MSNDIYRRPQHIEAHLTAVLERCPFCDSKKFSKRKPCPDCGTVTPSAKSGRAISPADRRKLRELDPVQDFPDDFPEDDETLPPTTDEIEALNYDNISDYLPTPSATQEIY